MHLIPYIYAWLFLLVAAILVTFLYGLSILRSKRHGSSEYSGPYECGVNPVEMHNPLHIRFYLIAVLFVIFDVELMLLFPWAAAFSKLGWDSLFSIFILLGFLVLGFVYEWKKGAFDWI